MFIHIIYIYICKYITHVCICKPTITPLKFIDLYILHSTSLILTCKLFKCACLRTRKLHINLCTDC